MVGRQMRSERYTASMTLQSHPKEQTKSSTQSSNYSENQSIKIFQRTNLSSYLSQGVISLIVNMMVTTAMMSGRSARALASFFFSVFYKWQW